jgi:hypothetical protein
MPYSAWLATRDSEVVYSEPAGQWMIRTSAIWDVHARHKTTAVADDIAWFAATAGLPGECEGNIACYFTAAHRLHGMYLGAHPAGRHGAEAVAAIDTLLETVVPAGEIKRPYQFDQRLDCRDLTVAIDGLSAAIANANRSKSEATLAKLAAARRLCP